LGPGQVGPGQVGPGQVGPGQVGPGQVGPGQVRKGTVGTEKLPAGPVTGDRAYEPPLVARVLLDVAGFDRELDYSVPPEMAGAVRPGCVVRVPLQGRRARGWVVAYPVTPPPGISLRPLARVTGWGPEPELVDLAGWAAWRWAGQRRSLLVTASALTAIRTIPPKTERPLVDPPGRVAVGRGARGAVAGGAVAGGAVAGGRGTGATGRQLIEQSWHPGTHLLRLPPAFSATELVLAAAERGPALVVAPTTGRAEAGCAALRGRGAQVALLPGGWAQARAGAQVVIGTRSAAWGPCPSCTSVIVLDAHDEALVQEQAPTWDAPTVAAERARRAGLPCFWVTACPTLELLAAAGPVQRPSRSEERAGWATFKVVDCRREDPRSGLYSQSLVQLLHNEPGRVVCVLNRKGRALLLDCGACGELATCEQCGASVAMVSDELSCRRCGTSRPVVCRSCGSDALRMLKLGVTRVREQLEALAGEPVGEVGASTEALPDARILVGTEAVLYREGDLARNGGVGAVAFLDFDQELLAPRYRAAEQALALLARASRLVGGRRSGGKVLVQTRAPTHPVIEAALMADPGHLARAEEPLRESLRLPPFSALALLSGPGADELAGVLKHLGPGATGDGPAGLLAGTAGSSVEAAGTRTIEVSKLVDARWVVRAPDSAALADALKSAGRPAGRVRVEVGPVRF